MPQLKEKRNRLKGNTSEVTREEISKLSAQYLIRRNHSIDLKSKAAEIELAVRRGTLVERKLVQMQATYLLIGMRQKLLNLGSHAHKFAGGTNIDQARKILREIGLSTLNEIRDLPNCVEKGWLQQLEKEES